MSYIEPTECSCEGDEVNGYGFPLTDGNEQLDFFCTEPNEGMHSIIVDGDSTVKVSTKTLREFIEGLKTVLPD